MTVSMTIFTGCVMEPYADFVASESVVSPGEIIYFTNRSYDASGFEWDFDDGYYSSNFNVSHFYDEPGLYNVKLTAFGKDNRTDRAFIMIEVLSTDLEITVKEWYDEYPVKDASVILYPSIEDWEDQTNDLIEGFTDINGRVLFTNLESGRRYYVDVWETNHDNYTLAAEDASWITTDRLTFGEVNYFTAWVDYYSSGKKSLTDRKALKQERMQNITSGKIRVKENK